MNETPPTLTPLTHGWPADKSEARVPDTSMLPGSGGDRAAEGDALHRAAQGAHNALDQLERNARPGLQRMNGLGERCVGSARDTVREHPLSSVATALVLGMLLARSTR